MRALVPVAALALVVSCGVGCGVGRPAPAPTGLRAAVRTELYFGRVRPGGGIVEDAAWQAFLADVVTPRFPDGFTVLDAAGQYRDGAAADVTRERAEVLVIVHDGDPHADAALREISTAYKERFGQRAVLRVDTRVTMGF